jgi:hypothetical protein
LSVLIQSYAALCTFVFVAISAWVSLRLLLLARRTGCKPELYLGLGILGTAVLGYGVLIAGTLMRPPGALEATGWLERSLQGVGQILHDAGVTMVILFVRTVFRPHERWARTLAAGMLVTLWGGHVLWELGNQFRSAGPGNVFWFLRYAVIWSYPLWTTIESYRYYARMRRRLAIGLADPLLVNRFFLWGTGALGTGLATWTSSLPFLLVGRPEALLAWLAPIQVATASIGVATVIVYLLTFLPPAAYRRWLTRAQSPPAGA